MLNSYSYEEQESLWKARWIASPIVYLSESNSMLSIEYELQRLQGTIRRWILLSVNDLSRRYWETVERSFVPGEADDSLSRCWPGTLSEQAFPAQAPSVEQHQMLQKSG